jgi:hypothetical protein
MQLPVLILDKMDGWHTYWMLLYNQFNNNLSLAAKGEVYPELAGMAFPEKIVELWSEWYLNPKVRYQYIKRLHSVLPRFLPRGPQDSLAVGANRLEYTRFENPQEVVADKLWTILQTFKAKAGPALQDHSQARKARTAVIADINGVKICQ